MVGRIPTEGESRCHKEVTGQHDHQTAAGQPSVRQDNALRRADLHRAAAGFEAEQAQVLIDEFIAQARELGIEPEPLRVQLSGGGTARTDKKGWHIKVNQSVAIGEDGGYYILSMLGGLRERVRGVRLTPTQPALQVSRGGRDGETGDLADFLTRRLSTRLNGTNRDAEDGGPVQRKKPCK